MRTESFAFTAAAGHRLSGRLDLPDGEPQAWAVFAHCFSCSKQSLAAVRIARALALRGIAVLRFDFTGLGESEGDFAISHFSANVEDLSAAIAALEAQGRRPSLLIGHSLGGTAVLAAAARTPAIQAVAVINAPFEAAHVLQLFGEAGEQLEAKGGAAIDLGGRPFRLDRRFIEDLQGQQMTPRIAGLRRPLLILHAPDDRIVPLEQASRIFQAARHPKSFLSLDGADHLLSNADDAAYAAELIAAWSSRYLATRAAAAQPQPEDGAVVAEETGAGRYQLEIAVGRSRFLADEPASVGGLGSGPSPYQLLSAALAACTAMTVRMYADRKNLPLQRVRVTVGHEKRAEQQPADRFSRSLHFDGPLDDEQRLRLLEIAGKCPVHRTLEAGADITTGTSRARAAQVPTEDPSAHAREMQQLQPPERDGPAGRPEGGR